MLVLVGRGADSRFADFLLENAGKRIAIEIDDDASHLPGHVSQVKYYDDLTKQNSMIHMGWAVYRWPVRVMQEQPERVKDYGALCLRSAQ